MVLGPFSLLVFSRYYICMFPPERLCMLVGSSPSRGESNKSNNSIAGTTALLYFHAIARPIPTFSCFYFIIDANCSASGPHCHGPDLPPPQRLS